MYQSSNNCIEYISLGKLAMDHLLTELPLSNWQFSKTTKQCNLFFKKASPMSCFRVDTEFDFPPALVCKYFSEIEKRK